MKKVFFAAAATLCLSLTSEASANDVESCLAYLQATNYRLAVAPCTAAAEQGDANQQYNLGIMYDQGLGVPPDFREAVFWFRSAALNGDAEAQYMLGLKYSLGEGVEQDREAAVRWFRTSAEQGNARAQFMLGTAYDRGLGVTKDPILAYMWFHVSVRNGFDTAIGMQDIVARSMTAVQIGSAESKAEQCLRSNYMNCQ
jgi:uncharacterized protein